MALASLAAFFILGCLLNFVERLGTCFEQLEATAYLEGRTNATAYVGRGDGPLFARRPRAFLDFLPCDTKPRVLGLFVDAVEYLPCCLTSGEVD